MFVHFHYFAAFAASAVHTSIGRPLKGFFDETRRSDRFKIIQKKNRIMREEEIKRSTANFRVSIAAGTKKNILIIIMRSIYLILLLVS